MENSIGLWEKKSQKGNVYYYGKTTIDGKNYKVMLFKNENKSNEKAPDYNMIIKGEEKKEEKVESSSSDQVFAEFGNQVDGISDEDIAF